jgi:hypothetical protein
VLIFTGVFPRAFLPILLFALGLPLRAQLNTDGPVKMTPDLALAIPLVQIKHDVTVKFPVLINATTVVKPGMALRNIYLPTVRNNNSEDLNAAHMGNMEESYSRAPGEAPQALPSEVAHEIERQRRVDWEVPINFQLALAQLPTDGIHLIYSTSGNDRNLADVRFNFFDGLFLGSPTPGVFVLGVETDSRSDKAGLKAGDQILSVNETPVPAELVAFPAFYYAVRKNAEDSHATSFSLSVRSPGESGSHTVNIATPPTIKSMLMQGF